LSSPQSLHIFVSVLQYCFFGVTASFEAMAHATCGIAI
jgi:hypothetical protein